MEIAPCPLPSPAHWISEADLTSARSLLDCASCRQHPGFWLPCTGRFRALDRTPGSRAFPEASWLQRRTQEQLRASAPLFFPGSPPDCHRGEGLPKLALSPSLPGEGPLGQGSVLAVGNRKGETRSPGKSVVHLMNWGAPFRETCRRVYTVSKTRVREG